MHRTGAHPRMHSAQLSQLLPSPPRDSVQRPQMSTSITTRKPAALATKVARFREAAAGMNVLEVLRECLRALAAQPSYGPLGGLVMREYDRTVRSIASASSSDQEAFLWLTEQQLCDADVDGGAAHRAHREDSVSCLQAELRDLNAALQVKQRRVEALEAQVTQMRQWMQSKEHRCEELETALEVSREYIDDAMVAQEQREAEKGMQDAEVERGEAGQPSQTALLQQLAAAEEAAAQCQRTVSAQLDQKNVLEERLDFLQDLLRAKVLELRTLRATQATLQSQPCPDTTPTPKQHNATQTEDTDDPKAKPSSRKKRFSKTGL